MEKKNVEYEESLAVVQHRHTSDLQSQRDQLSEAETMRQALQSEITTLHEKMAAMRQEVLTERQDAEESLRLTADREKVILEEELRKRVVELDNVCNLKHHIPLTYIYLNPSFSDGLLMYFTLIFLAVIILRKITIMIKYLI